MKVITDVETKGLHGDFLVATVKVEKEELQTITNLSDYKNILSQATTIVAHNVAYERECFKRWEVDTSKVRRWLCSMVLAHCVDKTHMSYSLEALAVDYNLQETKVKVDNFDELSDLLIERNRSDVRLCETLIQVCLRRHLSRFERRSDIERNRFLNRLINVWEQRSLFACYMSDMSLHGALVDVSFLDSLKEQTEAYISENTRDYYLPSYTKGEVVVKPYVSDLKKDGKPKKLAKAILEYTDRNGLVVSSVAHEAWDRVQLVPTKLGRSSSVSQAMLIRANHPEYINESGNIDATKLAEFVVKDKGVNPEASQLLVDFFIGNKLQSIIDSCEKYNECVDENNRAHSHFNVVGTRTGRLSSSNPNLQNVGGSKITNIAGLDALIKQQRKMITVPKGYKMLGADLDSIEVVILAHILNKFGDRRMLDVLATGESPHTRNAEIWNCTRLDAKRGLFTIVYGGTEFRLAALFNCSVPQAKKFLDNVNNGMPAITTAKQFYERMCVDLGGVFDLFGNFYNYDDVYSRDLKARSRAVRQLFNAVIQGTCASLIAYWTPQIVALCQPHGANMVSIVHDEVLIECPEVNAETLKVALNKLTQNRFDIPGLEGSRINADWNVGNTWLDIK